MRIQSRREKRQLLIGLLLFFFITTFIIWFYFLVENHLKTYKHTKHKFMIKFHPEWNVLSDYNGAAVTFTSQKETAMDIYLENISIVVQDLSTTPMTLEEYTSNAINQMKAVFKSEIKIVDSSDFDFHGYDAHQVIVIGQSLDPAVRFHIIWFIHDLKAYQITLLTQEDTSSNYLKLFKRMLKSFKLTD